jgi:hypothetical protein
MKKIAFAVLLLCSAFAWAVDPNPSDYTVNIHVSSSRILYGPPGSLQSFQGLNVLIDGKKYELTSYHGADTVLALGDYKAKLVRDDHRTAYESYQIYEFLFPDKKTSRFVVTGTIE